MSATETELTPEQLSTINDTLRVNLITNIGRASCEGINGRLILTRSVADLPGDQMIAILSAVARFRDFTEDNDSHGEHDFGSVGLFGEKWFWKFDYYDEDLEAFGHEVHVLTIMNSSDY